MMPPMIRIAIAIAAAVALSSPARAATWEIDPSHSTVGFTVRHLMISNVRGEFGKVRGTVTWERADFSDAQVDVTVDVASVDTREPERDTHLRSPDFFDAAKFPTLTFKSKRVAKGKSQGHLTLVGDLTIHGVTKEVAFDVTAPSPPQKTPWGAIAVAAEARATIHRKDFGLTWNKALESGGVLVGDDVKIEIALELDRK
jgi:polyisoprenoid-binding protein YceI